MPSDPKPCEENVGHDQTEKPGDPPEPIEQGYIAQNWLEQISKCDPVIYEMHPPETTEDNDRD